MSKVKSVTNNGEFIVLTVVYEYQEYAGAMYKEATVEIPLTVDDAKHLIKNISDNIVKISE